MVERSGSDERRGLGLALITHRSPGWNWQWGWAGEQSDTPHAEIFHQEQLDVRVPPELMLSVQRHSRKPQEGAPSPRGLGRVRPEVCARASQGRPKIHGQYKSYQKGCWTPNWKLYPLRQEDHFSHRLTCPKYQPVYSERPEGHRWVWIRSHLWSGWRCRAQLFWFPRCPQTLLCSTVITAPITGGAVAGRHTSGPGACRSP